jgi:hypothetical protein
MGSKVGDPTSAGLVPASSARCAPGHTVSSWSCRPSMAVAKWRVARGEQALATPDSRSLPVRYPVPSLGYRVSGTGYQVRCPALSLTREERRSHLPHPSPFHGRGPDAEHRGPRRGLRIGKSAHQVYMPGGMRSSTFQRIRFGLAQTAIRQFGNTAIIHVPGPTDGLDSIPFPLHNSYRC